MSAIASTIPAPRKINTKAIVLPIEHGSWGFVFEPLTAGLLIAFSPSAVWIVLLVVGAFLTRQPLKVLLNDWQAKRNLPQTAVARKFTLIYGAIFTFGLIGSLIFVKLDSFLPFLVVLPFAAYQIYCDAARQSRQLLPELTGAIAISSSAAVIALADNWTFPAAIALWGIFAARLIPSILYVRNRLKLEKGKEFSRFVPVFAHVSAFVLVGGLAFYGLSPVLTVAMFAVLLGRAAIGLSPYRKKVKAMKIGVWEVVYGTLTALSVVIGFYLKI
ncbi:MAG TPA: YwiC-like family protein [Pyrinomonadaceae bacterium]|nr:YwiC-like family protein [Pyrinomonadaceae bacterium]